MAGDSSKALLREPAFVPVRFRLPPLICHALTHRVFGAKSNGTIAASLLLAIFLWGGNNVGVKYLMNGWPPIWAGCARFLCAGLLLLTILRRTNWLGPAARISKEQNRALWWRGGLSLGVYIVAFNWALVYTSASHVALYLGASPVWALLWEGRPGRNWRRRSATAPLCWR